ncbi:MAG: hypothetical protein JWP88_1240 [Flaviaesturariibacter sp.]|nr:hypothetical protein [Flaviaesturariibacter sp.]
MTRIVVTLIAFFYWHLIAYAQQAKQYSFSHFTTADGLAANFINGTVQDSDGYIWLATINGLQRYDGNGFLTLKSKPEIPNSIPSDNISLLYRDKKGRIWLSAVNNTVGIFDPKKLAFTPTKVLGRKNYTNYTGKYFFEDFDGDLLLHDFSSLYRYDESAGCFRPDKELPTPAGWKVSHISLDLSEKKYWMSADSGMAMYNAITRHLNYKGHNPDHDPVIAQAPSNGVYHLLPLKDKVLFCTWPGASSVPVLYMSQKKTGITQKSILSDNMSLGYHEIGGLFQQKSGRIWIYGYPLLVEWKDQASQFIPVPNEFKNEQSIKFDRIFSSFEDNERNVWLATDNGVFVFNPDAQLFNGYNLVRPGMPSFEAPVQAVCEMKNGNLFVGCWGKGLFYFNKKLEPLPLPASLQKYKDLTVWDMCLSEKTGKLWIGLQPGGVLVYDSKTGKTVYHKPSLVDDRTIRQIVEDEDGNMWLGTQGGKIVKWNAAKATGDPTKGYELVLKTGLIQKLHIDREGYLWAGTLGNGLFKIETHSNEVLESISLDSRKGSRLFANDVFDMTQYDDSTLIVTAGCLNILHTNTGKVDLFGVAQGLPSNSAIAVQKDDNNILWVGMLNGLCRVNLVKKIATFYDRSDGIPYDNFSGAGVEKLADGRIVFFTDHNFLTFDPRRFFQAAKPPKPVITGISLEGRPLLLDSLQKAGSLELQYNNTSLIFEFSGLSFTKQKKLHYYYKLEGVDKDWVHIDNDNRAIYNYLPPDRYVFKVKSENADGLTSGETHSVTIIVNPPMWRTWWFFASVILILGLGIFVIDRERLKRLHSLQQVRTQIAGNLHQEVETTLGNINVLSEIAKIRAGTNVEQSKEFIDQISQKSRYMMEAMDDVLWSIDPKNDSMGRTLLRIKEYTEGLRHTYNVDIDLILDRKVQSLQIDMALRHELFFYYKEALAFLIDHISCDQIFVHLKQRKSMLYLEMLSECDEKDWETFRSKLTIATRNRAKAMKGAVEITTDRKSVSIVLQVPV